MYHVLWMVAVVPCVVLYRLGFRHRDRLPEDQGFVLCSNHATYLDPVLIALVRWRPIHFMAKVELFTGSRIVATLVRWARAFPIRRGTPDRNAIRLASQLVQRGEAIGIFPEGTRGSDGVGEGSDGAALIALRTGFPIVPVGIHGAGEILPEGARLPRFPRITVSIGEPLSPEDFPGASRRERATAITGELMRRIEGAVLDASERGSQD